MTKRCPRCGLEKDVGSFHKDRTHADGLQSACADCVKVYHRKYYTENAGKVSARRKKKYEATKQVALARNRKLRYGVTPEQVDRMVEEQGNRCAICGSSNPGGHGTWNVDHDHQTGNIRGLLCLSCNNGLGRFRDSKELLYKAAAYLERADAQFIAPWVAAGVKHVMTKMPTCRYSAETSGQEQYLRQLVGA